jgi:CDP-diacylglycerol---glycerol-3-phosphate 3-phosphatidyltransferase
LQATRWLLNLSSGENRAGWADSVTFPFGACFCVRWHCTFQSQGLDISKEPMNYQCNGAYFEGVHSPPTRIEVVHQMHDLQVPIDHCGLRLWVNAKWVDENEHKIICHIRVLRHCRVAIQTSDTNLLGGRWSLGATLRTMRRSCCRQPPIAHIAVLAALSATFLLFLPDGLTYSILALRPSIGMASRPRQITSIVTIRPYPTIPARLLDSCVLYSDPIEGDNSRRLGPRAPRPGYLRRAFPSFPWYRLPNLLTYMRCLLVPILAVAFYIPGRHREACALFVTASLTDFFDGYLSRRWDITTSFGAFLDPVADKLIVSTAMILLAGAYGAVVAVPASIILARELAVSALREWMAERGLRDLVKVGIQGKIKTALTMISISVLLYFPRRKSSSLSLLSSTPGRVAIGLLLACTAITVTSSLPYFRAAICTPTNS